MKLGTQTASLTNHMYSRAVIGQPEPTVGMGATLLHWTDRDAATITKVFTAGAFSYVTVRKDNAKRIDQNGMSEIHSGAPDTARTTMILTGTAIRELNRRDRNAKPHKPVSLFKFMVDEGYLAPDPQLKAALNGTGWWIIATRGRGMTMDRARAKCVEAGYLHCEGHNTDRPATSTINDLLDLIAEEARGTKQYPMHDQPDDIGGSWKLYGDAEPEAFSIEETF